MENAEKMIVVGRHTPVLPSAYTGYEVRRKNILFPEDVCECRDVLLGLLHEANNWGTGAALVFQSVPGQMAAAICSVITDAITVQLTASGNCVSLPPMPVIGVIMARAKEREVAKIVWF